MNVPVMPLDKYLQEDALSMDGQTLGVNNMTPRCEFLITALQEHCADREWVVAEIGVWEGKLALELLREEPRIKRYYLVDPYQVYEGPLQSKYNWVQREWDIFYSVIVRPQFKQFPDRAFFVRQQSVPAMETINEQLDLVYIDGDHKYESVKEDVEGWYEKVCDGGILGGHDYGGAHKRYWGVSKAVDEFVAQERKVLRKQKTDWYIVK